jgi:hypothetical protein
VVHAAEYERFAPGAFDGSVGKTLKLNGTRTGNGTLIDAVVSGDGLSVALTIEPF